jgi:hypothetical protein
MKALLGFLAIVVVATSAFSAPIPKAIRKANEPWVPLELGTTWEFVQDGDGGDNTTVVERREITKLEVKDGVTYATQKASGLTTQGYRVDADGVALISTNNAVHKHPRVIVTPSMAEGDSWTWDAGGYIETRTVGKIETLKLPAGNFDAIPIKSEYNQNGVVFQTATVWYSRGIGLVQIDYEGYSHKLKTFTKGK